MFARVKRDASGPEGRSYLQIVESFREGGRVRQRVVASLGRLEDLVQTGRLDALTQSLARYSETIRVVSAARGPNIGSCQARAWGPSLVFDRLWQRQGVPSILTSLARGRRFRFDVERAIFALALHRLCEPGSDLQTSAWLPTVEADGFAGLELQHLYRAVSFLHQSRAELERRLFFLDRDLFSQEIDLLFLDTTSLYIYRDEETALRRRGYSRDRRPDLPQVILAVAVDRNGWPIAWEILPGNTADAEAFRILIEHFRERFQIRRVVVVADRGMISESAIRLLEDGDAPFEYVFGCRLRNQTEVNERVLNRGGRYQPVAPNLKVKQVWASAPPYTSARRYVICFNEEEAKKDAAARAAMLAALEERLQTQGAKGLIGNKGYARFLRIHRGSVSINRDAVEADARYDGKFVLRTNTDLSPAEVALTYKGLWRVERTFRTEKSTLQVRPVYHQRDDTTVGHIAGAFLALRLQVDLQKRLEEREVDVRWRDLMRDLAQLQAVHLELEGIPYRVRTDFRGAAHAAFLAAGVQAPPRVTRIAAV